MIHLKPELLQNIMKRLPVPGEDCENQNCLTKDRLRGPVQNTPVLATQNITHTQGTKTSTVYVNDMTDRPQAPPSNQTATLREHKKSNQNDLTINANSLARTPSGS